MCKLAKMMRFRRPRVLLDRAFLGGKTWGRKMNLCIKRFDAQVKRWALRDEMLVSLVAVTAVIAL